MRDPRQRFTATAQAYARHRPGYPDALFEAIGHVTGVRAPARVADVGCGTGIATRQLLARGHAVLGLDPNRAMLAQARAHPLSGSGLLLGLLQAQADATGLRAGAVELITAGQAFHWFPLEATLGEWHRVLGERGWAVVFWNVRARSAFTAAYEALLEAHSPDFRGVPHPLETLAALSAALDGRVAERQELRFAHGQRLDRAGLHGRAWSSSYVVHGVADRAAFDRELDALFDAHARDGEVVLPYETVALLWRFGKAVRSRSGRRAQRPRRRRSGSAPR